jgi:serine/threonine-protein kinase RsbT
MTEAEQGTVPIQSESDIIVARRAVRDVATRLCFGVTDVTRIITAASELARNIFVHAGSGVMRWSTLRRNSQAGVELAFDDHGPGIPDIDLAMKPGYATQGGLGLGLPGSKRLMDEMEIRSVVGQGTTVTVRKWLRE